MIVSLIFFLLAAFFACLWAFALGDVRELRAQREQLIKICMAKGIDPLPVTHKVLDVMKHEPQPEWNRFTPKRKTARDFRAEYEAAHRTKAAERERRFNEVKQVIGG